MRICMQKKCSPHHESFNSAKGCFPAKSSFDRSRLEHPMCNTPNASEIACLLRNCFLSELDQSPSLILILFIEFDFLQKVAHQFPCNLTSTFFWSTNVYWRPPGPLAVGSKIESIASMKTSLARLASLAAASKPLISPL